MKIGSNNKVSKQHCIELRFYWLSTTLEAYHEDEKLCMFLACFCDVLQRTCNFIEHTCI